MTTTVTTRIVPIAAATLALLVSCAKDEPRADPHTADERDRGETTHRLPSAGEDVPGGTLREAVVYLPVYSSVYYRDGEEAIDLAATISVRNTDPGLGLRLASVEYYDSNGKLVRPLLREPVWLGPLRAQTFVIDADDRSGGVAASVIVKWDSNGDVSDPIVEAVMISTESGQGISFTTTGKTILSWEKGG